MSVAVHLVSALVLCPLPSYSPSSSSILRHSPSQLSSSRNTIRRTQSAADWGTSEAPEAQRRTVRSLTSSSLERAEARAEGGGAWRFRVTVAHGDTGWDHYADKWDVVAPDGSVLGTRVLLHPHETEQPFTRALGGVEVPEGVNEVTLRAHDRVHGYGGQELTVELPK